MKDLKELIQVISKQKTSSIQIIGDGFDGDTKQERLYEGILNNEFESDDDAAHDLYKSNANSKSYKNLRTNLKKRLINTVFFIDQKQAGFNEYQKAYYTCCKEWAAVKILLGREARVAAIQLAHKILRQTLKFEFTDLTIDVARILRLHYAVFEGDEKKFNQYDEIVQTQEAIHRAETAAEKYYEQLVLNYVTAKSTQTEINEQAAAFSEALEQMVETHSSHNLHRTFYLIEVIRYMAVNDYKATNELCGKAIEFFESKPYVSKISLVTFLYQQLACLIQLKEFEKGKSIAEKCLSLITPGLINWFKAQELYFMLNMHCDDLQKAYLVLDSAMRHSRFRFQSEAIIETWKIYEAFIRFLLEIDQIQALKGKKPGNFRLSKFLNELPIFSKDKKGMNIPIMILNMLFMTIQGKHDDFIEKAESIRKYASRHLKTDHTERSETFIRMLLLLPANAFNKEEVKSKATPLLEELKAIPLETANQSFEIEIIPYENLWEFLINAEWQ